MLNRFRECLNTKYTHAENSGSYALKWNGSKLYIFFEWSNGREDWKNNFDFPAKPYRKMKDVWFCHRGFLKVWKSIEPHISEAILDPDVKEIEIVGYSHGGAIAQLCHEYVRFYRPDIDVRGFGFGAPRVVWGFVKKSVKRRFEGFTVVRNGEDIVTHLPPAVFGFRHICEVQKIGKHIGYITDHRPNMYEYACEYEDTKNRGEINQ